MLRHIVLWTFLDEADGRPREENVAITKEMLERCKTIPGLRRMELGVDELGGPAASHLSLVVDFDDWAAYETYRDHPLHQEVVNFLALVRDGRMSADYLVDD